MWHEIFTKKEKRDVTWNDYRRDTLGYIGNPTVCNKSKESVKRFKKNKEKKRGHY